MVKLMGALMIIISSASVGGFIYKSLKNRCDSLKNLLLGLDILQSEIVFRRRSLSQAVVQAGNGTKGAVSKMFGEICKNMEGGQLFESAFAQSREALREGGITKEDIEAIQPITAILGKYDSFEQAQMLKNVRITLEKQYKDSYDELMQKGKLYRAMGVSLGIMIALIMV